MNQDYNNIEIILVDDGSPDKSGEIIDNLALKDNRIVVIHKENGGVSSARNAGLKVATGEYVTFVDGDDWVDKDYITYFVNLLEVSRCDIAMNKSNYTETNNFSSDEYSIVKAEKAIEWIYLGDIFVAVWNKMYRKILFDDNKIFFNNDIWKNGSINRTYSINYKISFFNCFNCWFIGTYFMVIKNMVNMMIIVRNISFPFNNGAIIHFSI